MITALKRQTNPNWSALFVRVDSAPLEAELRNTLLSFADPRLELFAQTHAPPVRARTAVVVCIIWAIFFFSSHGVAAIPVYIGSDFILICCVVRLQYDTDDAGYKAVDAALHQLLQRKECQWISVTTSDNAYGSEVQPCTARYLLPHWLACYCVCFTVYENRVIIAVR
jgi:hypothetical protein